VMTLSGSATKAQYQTALQSVTYRNTSDSPTTTARSVKYQVTDGTDASAEVTATVNITAVNDAPTLSISLASTTYNDGPANEHFNPVSGTLSASDPDGPTSTFGITGGTDNGTTVSKVGTYGTLVVNKATGAYTYTPDSAAINALPVGTTPSDSFT